jgi:hypothetical protein
MTLKDLPTASAQAVFDVVIAHLRKQNAKSITDFGCRYHSPNGLKCAAGTLIAKDEYCEQWEGLPWDTLVVRRSVPFKHHQLIRRLQRIHDNAKISDWEISFQTLAIEFGLKYEPPTH